MLYFNQLILSGGLTKDPEEKTDLSKERAEDTTRLGALRATFEEKPSP